MEKPPVLSLAPLELPPPGASELQFEGLIQQMLQSGYGVTDKLLPPALIERLAANLLAIEAADDLRQARIGKQAFLQKNEDIRTDLIHWLQPHTTDEAEVVFHDLINGFIAYLNRTCFTALRSCEFHYALYEPGSFYRRHLDQFTNDSGRKFSIVCYLNQDWQPTDGGELVLYLPTGEVTILPQAGRLVFFQADQIEHEVKVAHRERRSVTGWLKDR